MEEDCIGKTTTRGYFMERTQKKGRQYDGNDKREELYGRELGRTERQVARVGRGTCHSTPPPPSLRHRSVCTKSRTIIAQVRNTTVTIGRHAVASLFLSLPFFLFFFFFVTLAYYFLHFTLFSSCFLSLLSPSFYMLFFFEVSLSSSYIFILFFLYIILFHILSVLQQSLSISRLHGRIVTCFLCFTCV